MSEEHSSETGPAKSIIKMITDIATYVAAFIAYLVAVRGGAETPYPKTTAQLTILLTSALVVGWRWSQLKRKKGQGGKDKLVIVGRREPPRQHSWLARILDPLKQNSREDYILPLVRRRVEAGVLLSLILLTLGWSGVNLPAAAAEWGKDSALTCSYSSDEHPLLIVIADLLQTGSQPQLLISDKIYESLVALQLEGRFDVCRLPETIQLSTLAVETARKYDADMVIWGRSDVIYEIHLEAPALENPDRTLSELSSAEAASVEFQFKEPEHIAYVTQFALSEAFWLTGQAREAQTRLAGMLAQAKMDGLETTYPQDMAEGYYQLGLYYDPGFSSNPDEQKSLAAYATAMTLDPNLFAAWLNHGLLLMNASRTAEALTDFTYLIDNNTPLKCSAYVNRASLQSDPEAEMNDLNTVVQCDPTEGYFFRGVALMNRDDYQGAIEDFEKLVALEPEYYFNYYLLGQAQLYAGETEAARQTYLRSIPYLDEESRQQVISLLQESAEASPEIKPAVEEIIRELKNAKLP